MNLMPRMKRKKEHPMKKFAGCHCDHMTDECFIKKRYPKTINIMKNAKKGFIRKRLRHA